MMLGGTAIAGRGHGGRGGPRHSSGGVVVRDHRAGGPVVRSAPAVRDHRGGHRPKYVRHSGGRYVFPGGVVRVYKRPVIRARYYDRRVRPAIIVESYDPVPGYIWVAGNWTWGGAEWVWTPGYWAVAEEPVVTGGFSVSAGISIH
jgi:hypothetical protein